MLALTNVDQVFRRKAVQLGHDLARGIARSWTVRGRQRPFTVENSDQCLSRPCNATFHGSNCATADPGGVLISKPAGADENKCLPLFARQRFECSRGIRQIRRPRLFAVATGNPFSGFRVPGYLSPRSTTVGIELVAQDCEQPCLEIGAGHERATRLPSLNERLLGEIVGPLMSAGKRAREGSEKRHERQQIRFERRSVPG